MTYPNAKPIPPADPVLGDPAIPASPTASQPAILPLPAALDPATAAPAPEPPAPPSTPVLPDPTPSGASRGRGVSRGVVAVLAPVLAVVMFSAGVFFGNDVLAPIQAAVPAASAAVSGPDSNLALIEEAWRDIKDNYVDSANLDYQALAYGAIRGITEAVGDDGHTSFMTADQVKASEQSLSGTFTGIGVQLSGENARPTVGTVIPNTPAEEAGLLRGDQILAVDGKTTAGETVDQTVARVRGPEGDPVTLTIGRSGVADFDVTITRRKFDLPLVSWAMVPGRKVAMIRLEQFATGSTKGLQDAITKAKAAGATALIFDVRFNPGGYVNEAVGVASQFLPEGVVYQAVDKTGKEKDATIEAGGLATDIPLVVLADGDTASAAEIVTGAIQDAKRGTVVGVKTFGTGTVLGRFDLADGSALRIGMERWLTRNGRPIWHEGLDPDVKVELPAATASDPAVPLVPYLLRDMTAAQLAASKDTQVLKALELLKGDG
jgi:carboxyl-terminal processing protease